ncbi:MAG: LamG domain-containing protein [Clostridiales Family XIII bacterium]|jgi:hypothetical protein|nr:LamG domain-containing protein [Clostridiales Family XIII bacterium]
MPNIGSFNDPLRSKTVSSWNEDPAGGKRFYLLITPPIDASADTGYVKTGHVEAGLLMHRDGIYNSMTGGVPHHKEDTNVWSDISGNGNDMQLMVIEGGGTLDPDVSDRIHSRAIYFNGAGDYARNDTIKTSISALSPNQITVEVCFREEPNPTTGSMLFEYAPEEPKALAGGWNIASGSFGLNLHNDGFNFTEGKAHTVVRTGNNYDISIPHRNFNIGVDMTKFTTISMVISNVTDSTGRIVYINGSLVTAMSGGNGGSTATTYDSRGQIGSFPLSLAIRLAQIGLSGQVFFKGEIASLRIYDHKLSVAEIQHNYEEDLFRFGG